MTQCNYPVKPVPYPSQRKDSSLMNDQPETEQQGCPGINNIIEGMQASKAVAGRWSVNPGLHVLSPRSLSTTPTVRSVASMATDPSSSAAQSASTSTRELRKIKAVPLSPEAFRPFGQVIGYSDDGKAYDKEDAQLQGFDSGTPRFYIMRLPERGLKFNRITFHAKVTQCLGLLAPMSHWYLGVSRPSGSLENFPKEEDLTVFRIPHGVYVKLEKDFYNLELSDTNVVDHNTHDYRMDGIDFEVVDEAN